MPSDVVAVVGAQWGDEAKGKVVDILAQKADLVVRYGGGSNAGHQIENEFGTLSLHGVPSGVCSPQARSVVGAGCVVNPTLLVQELAKLSERGVDTDRIFLEQRAHMVMPYHIILEKQHEQSLGKEKIGSTLQGIGPAYTDRSARTGFMLGELRDFDTLHHKVEQVLRYKNHQLRYYTKSSKISSSNILEELRAAAEVIVPKLCDSRSLIDDLLDDDGYIVLEGQLGVMRDLVWGVYPYVTSSFPTAGGAFVGSGVPITYLTRVIGVTKAYVTVVGTGSFPTQLTIEEEEYLRQRGKEFGTTTGRPRQCGWLDIPALHYAIRTCGMHDLVLTKLDVLDELDEIKVCVAYELDGKVCKSFPMPYEMHRIKPIYETFPGWKEDTTQAREMRDLPKKALSYIDAIEELVNPSKEGLKLRRKRIEIVTVSVGPHRKQTITRRLR